MQAFKPLPGLCGGVLCPLAYILPQYIVGSFYVNWIVYALQRIECDEGYRLADLLQELAVLEHQALGRVKHGTTREGSQEHADPVE